MGAARARKPRESRAERTPARPARRTMPPALKLVAMREHSLLSLFELSHELTVVLDASGIADLVLFNLMGHLGTARAVLFVEKDGAPGRLEPIRTIGLGAEVANALAVAFEPALAECPD